MISKSSLQLKVTDPRHIADDGYFAGKNLGAEEKNNLGNSFQNLLVSAIKSVNNRQVHADKLSTQFQVDPTSVDIHDLTIAQQKAQVSMDLTRVVLSRTIQSYQSLINMR